MTKKERKRLVAQVELELGLIIGLDTDLNIRRLAEQAVEDIDWDEAAQMGKDIEWIVGWWWRQQSR